MQKTALLLSLAARLFAQTVCINSGGPAIASPVCAADQYATGGAVWGPGSPGYIALPAGIWADLRYGPSFAYDILLSNGLYSVKLDLIEPTQTAPNLRRFVINANGVQSAALDLFVLAGGLGVPYSTTLDQIAVTNGVLHIAFTASVRSAVVSAIEITALPPPPPSPVTIDRLSAPPSTGFSLLYTDAQGHVLQGKLPGLSVDANGNITFVAQLKTPASQVITVASDTPNAFPIPGGYRYCFITKTPLPADSASDWFAAVSGSVVLNPPPRPGDIVQMMCF